MFFSRKVSHSGATGWAFLLYAGTYHTGLPILAMSRSRSWHESHTSQHSILHICHRQRSSPHSLRKVISSTPAGLEFPGLLIVPSWIIRVPLIVPTILWMMPYTSVFLFFLDHLRPHALQGSFLPLGPTLHSGDVRAEHSAQFPLSGALFCLRSPLL